MIKKNISIYSLGIICMLAISGCTAMEIQPVNAGLDLKHVCIKENLIIVSTNQIAC